MTRVREPAVAGLFYPGAPGALSGMVDAFLQEEPAAAGSPKGIIVPHAGYVYSGSIAATAYRLFANDRDVIRRVVLLGPSHRVGFHGLAAPSADRFSTPLGPVIVDRAGVDTVLALPQVRLMDEAHLAEHSLEVQIPFLQRVLDSFTLVPLVVGDASAREVSEAIDLLWGGDETRFVISSDLSHYHDYETARRMDRATCRAIETFDEARIGFGDACGRIPVIGFLESARRRGLRPRLLDLRNSGDTAGSRDQVVGYAAFRFDA